LGPTRLTFRRAADEASKAETALSAQFIAAETGTGQFLEETEGIWEKRKVLNFDSSGPGQSHGRTVQQFP